MKCIYGSASENIKIAKAALSRMEPLHSDGISLVLLLLPNCVKLITH